MASAYIWDKPDSATGTALAAMPAYLDYNATTPIEPAAVEAMTAAARAWANPSSVHGAGRKAKGALEAAREQMARYLSCQPQAIVFTSGGTEALGLTLHGVPAATRIVSAVEHSAVLAQAGGAIVAPVDGDGIIDLAALEGLLAQAEGPVLVAVMQVNNETGVIQPIDGVLRLARDHGARVLVDAVQAAGKLSLPAADFVAVSAHKLGGPPGVGALIVRCAEDLSAVQRGGGQERGFRAGTENLPGIAGFAAALEARADTNWIARVTEMRDRLEERLRAGVPSVEIFGAGAPRLGTTSCIRMPGVAASTQLIALDLAGYQVSSGAACSSGKVKASHVLAAMGIGPEAAGEAIRVSLGWHTTAAEVESFAEAWTSLAKRQAAKAA
ncbi:cysteine desulfurase family protein [Sphingoaurantiacus capsulatus]|uniref:Cysteine desulfurase n=1 Tax=Sphingoaurantiacus capsulatus TaxID=1771310 RepID=A0ABV7XET2_9SPHN